MLDWSDGQSNDDSFLFIQGMGQFVEERSVRCFVEARFSEAGYSRRS